MGFPEHRRALTDAAFATFGEDAAWDGIEAPVRVRFRTEDEEGGFSQSRFITRTLMMRVRSWEVAEPDDGQAVVLAAGPHAGRYVVSGEPQLDGKGVWSCPVRVASA